MTHDPFKGEGGMRVVVLRSIPDVVQALRNGKHPVKIQIPSSTKTGILKTVGLDEDNEWLLTISLGNFGDVKIPFKRLSDGLITTVMDGEPVATSDTRLHSQEDLQFVINLLEVLNASPGDSVTGLDEETVLPVYCADVLLGRIVWEDEAWYYRPHSVVTEEKI